MKQIFIGGCERSGTTMLGVMLGQAPGGITIPEAEFISRLAHDHPGILQGTVNVNWALESFAAEKRFRVWGIDLARFETQLNKDAMPYADLISALVTFFAEEVGNPRPIYWVDHTPANLKNASTLINLFPDARMVHILRDGRAVASSLLKVDWGPKTIPAAANFWMEALAHSFSAEIFLSPHKVKRIRYEDIVKEPETQLATLCEFCGIPFHASMLEDGGLNPAFLTMDQHKLVGSAPKAERSLAWKKELTERQIEIFECITGDMLSHMGYETCYWPQGVPHRSLERYKLEVREFIYREIVNRWKMYLRFRRVLNSEAASTHRKKSIAG